MTATEGGITGGHGKSNEAKHRTWLRSRTVAWKDTTKTRGPTCNKKKAMGGHVLIMWAETSIEVLPQIGRNLKKTDKLGVLITCSTPPP